MQGCYECFGSRNNFYDLERRIWMKEIKKDKNKNIHIRNNLSLVIYFLHDYERLNAFGYLMKEWEQLHAPS
jgi:hypothetical protein